MVVVKETTTTVTVAETLASANTFTFKKRKDYLKNTYENPREFGNNREGIRSVLEERGEKFYGRLLSFDGVRVLERNEDTLKREALRVRQGEVSRLLERAAKDAQHASEEQLARMEAAIAILTGADDVH
jgi:hypothetical protein